MKRFFTFTLALAAALTSAPGQDAATEEQLGQLRGHVETLQTSNANLQKRLADLESTLQELREELRKPNPNHATPEDVRRLAEKLQEVDRKREADKNLILEEIAKLGKAASDRAASERAAAAARRNPPPADPPATSEPPRTEEGFYHVVANGDTLSTIAAAFREKGVKVTTDQILKANPGLSAKRLIVGKKIFIPASKP